VSFSPARLSMGIKHRNAHVSKPKLRVMAVALASVIWTGLSLADPPAGSQPQSPADAESPTTRPLAANPTTRPAEPVEVMSDELTRQLELKAVDKPNDDGTAIMVIWKKMDFEGPDVFYEIMMAESANGPFYPQGRLLSQFGSGAYAKLLSEFPGGFGFDANHIEGPDIRDVYSKKDWWGRCPCSKCQYHAVQIDRFMRDSSFKKPIIELDRGRSYYFKLRLIRDGRVFETAGPPVAGAAVSNWFANHKWNVLIATIILSIIIMTAGVLAKRYAHKLFIRRIGGLEAVDDALGRAAEMGKPVFFCHGTGDLGAPVTISAVNILGKVAERVAEYGTEMKVTCMNYMVMQVSQEMVRDAYTRQGRPDAYRDDNVFFVTADTFAYSAAVGGMMIREQAGTAFFFGSFGSESLLLSETGR